MDGRRFIRAMFASDKAKSITQVVTNLPKDAAEYLDAFRGILNERSNDEEFKLPKIHVYGFSKAEDPDFDFHQCQIYWHLYFSSLTVLVISFSPLLLCKSMQRIRIVLAEVAVDVEMRRVHLVAPGKWMLCASFMLPKTVALAEPMDI